MNNSRVILLDLGGVVFESTGTSNNIIDWKIVSQLNKKYGVSLSIGEDKFPEFLQNYNHLTNQQLTPREFLSGVYDTLNFNNELIEFLKPLGEIIIVSDNYRENIAYNRKRYSFHNWAKKQFYSYEFQLLKSNPVFFERLLNKLTEFDRDALLFIDDSPKKLLSAQMHGIRGVLYKDVDQIKKEVNSILKTEGKPVFETERLVVREFKGMDVYAVHEYAKQADVVKYEQWGPNTLKETASFISNALATSIQTPRMEYEFCLVLKSAGNTIGGCGVYLDEKDGIPVIGYTLNPKFWNNGYATEVATGLVDFAINKVGVKQLRATCDTRNIASKRVLEKSGFVLLETIENHLMQKGQMRHTFLFEYPINKK